MHCKRNAAVADDGNRAADYTDLADLTEGIPELGSQQELDDYIAKLESDMRDAAKKFEFEKAAQLRDRIKALKQLGVTIADGADLGLAADVSK